MKLWAMPCRATQDRWVRVDSSDKMWFTGEGNGKPLQYSWLENPMNSMKRQKDMINLVSLCYLEPLSYLEVRSLKWVGRYILFLEVLRNSPFICFSQFLESAPIFWLAALHHFNLCFHCYISFLLWYSWPPLIRTLEITETHLYDLNSLPF